MSAATDPVPGAEGADEPRQRVVRVSPRRARLTAVEGTDARPEVAREHESAPAVGGMDQSGPNDARMRQDVPPHY